MDLSAPFLLLVFGLIFLFWGRHSLRTKEVHLRRYSFRDEHRLRGQLSVQFFGYMVGGSGLLMLLSLLAALISRDGKYLGVMCFLGGVIFFLGYGGAIVFDFSAPDTRDTGDGDDEQPGERDDSDPWKYTRKRRLPGKAGSSSAAAKKTARAGASARKVKAIKG